MIWKPNPRVVVSALLALAVTGCGGPDRWDRAHRAYCEAYSEERARFNRHVDVATERITSLQASPDAAERTQECLEAGRVMTQAWARLAGFGRSTNMLAGARGEKLPDVEAAGLALNNPEEILRSSWIDVVHACRRGEVNEAITLLNSARTETFERMDYALGLCASDD